MQNSKIEWTDHTFNPWHGCMKVSEGCKNCYAETLDNRWKGGHWGPGSPRKQMSEAYWRQPLKWNAAAEKAGKMAKVFCASMADVFEGHPDTLPHLKRLFILIENTPHLIWQLLTKRPENILPLIPERWGGRLPDNVWIGTSVENQAAADTRIPHLLQVPARVRFLSMEPLLGPLTLRRQAQSSDEIIRATLAGAIEDYSRPVEAGIDWVIVGGESGPHARPMHPDWVRGIRDQCAAAGVAFFFKQWGEWAPVDFWGSEPGKIWCNERGIAIDSDIEPRQMQCFGQRVQAFKKLGKKTAGRLLDGSEYSEFPSSLTAEDANKRLKA
ncbi:phage Gp37/Gp68 family protein [Chitinophaga sp. YIM B06452]|uniref:phage Gp37/Gp68 family protein n=1 Tax=Chitinophaga sp. YIM B06452 TaxID=3082158 RepID=UPI0031FF3C82